MGNMTKPDTDVVGMWVAADGHLRQELLPDGRYDEARGDRQSAYTGRYTVTGTHIDYVDATGITATGDIRDGVLFLPEHPDEQQVPVGVDRGDD